MNADPVMMESKGRPHTGSACGQDLIKPCLNGGALFCYSHLLICIPVRP